VKKAISPSRRCPRFADEGRQDARELAKVNTIHNHALSYIDRPSQQTTSSAAKTASMMLGISIQRFLLRRRIGSRKAPRKSFGAIQVNCFSSNRRQT